MSNLTLLGKKLTPAEILEIWMKKYDQPHSDHTAKAFAILNDPNHPWKDDAQKDLAIQKYQKLETEDIDNAILINSMHELIQKHNEMVAVLKRLYLTWSIQVAYEGVQQKEMMQGQADILQGIFDEIKKILE